jgi:WD40 repeat protein
VAADTNSFDRLLVGPDRAGLEQFLHSGWEAMTRRFKDNLLPWPLPGLEETLRRCATDPGGRHEWLSGPSNKRAVWRSALAVAWWRDFIGRLHVRMKGLRGHLKHSPQTQLFGAEEAPALSWLYPGRSLARHAAGKTELIALCDCGVCGPLDLIAWMGPCCGPCHDRQSGGDPLPPRSAAWSLPKGHRFAPETLLATDGSALGGVNADGTLTVFRTSNGEVIGSISVGKEGRLLALGPGGARAVVVGGGQRHLTVWDVARGAELATLPALHGNWWPVARFTPGGEQLAIFDTSGEPVLWEVATGAAAERIGSESNRWGAYSPNLAVSPDGRVLLTVDSQNGLRQWDLTTREMQAQAPLASLFGYRQNVNVAFSPDGRRACICGRHVVLWDVVRREVRPSFGHYAAGMNTLPSFAPLNRALLILSEGGLDVWAPDGSARQARCSWAGGELVWGAVLPDGGLVTVTEDGVVRLWPASAILGPAPQKAQETQPT